MANDLERQVDEIEAENSKVRKNVEDREAALKLQIGELGELSTLRDKKGDQDRELELLDKEIDLALDSEIESAKNGKEFQETFQKSVFSTFEETCYQLQNQNIEKMVCKESYLTYQFLSEKNKINYLCLP